MKSPRQGGQRIRCGLDAVDIPSFARVLATSGDRFVEVCFTPNERLEAEGRTDRFASRFAAKEAVAKALGCGLMQGVAFRDIEIVGGGNRPPDVVLRRGALKQAKKLKLKHWTVSLTHEGDLAVALVVAMQDLQARN